MTAEPYAFWRAQLAGKPIDLDDKLPRCGFYRKSDQPIAIWMNGDEMVAKIGSGKIKPADAGFAEQTFAWCCRQAISHEVYTAVLAGEPWPDAPPDVKAEIGDNLPADPFERLMIELEAHEERIALFLKTPITDEEQATKAGLWSGKVAGLGKELDAMREVEKRPHDEAGKAVQAKFKPKVEKAALLARQLKDHMSAFVLAKKRRAEAEERERQEAVRKAAASLEMPAPAEREIARQPGKVVTGGVSVRTRQIAVITDLPAACAFYAGWENPPRELIKLIEGFAEKNLKGGSAVPGAELKTIETVA